MAISSRPMLGALLMLSVLSVLSIDPLDFLLSSNMAQFSRYRPVSAQQRAAVTPDFGKRAPPGCVCTEFLGCHGPGCMRRMYPKNN